VCRTEWTLHISSDGQIAYVAKTHILPEGMLSGGAVPPESLLTQQHGAPPHCALCVTPRTLHGPGQVLKLELTQARRAPAPHITANGVPDTRHAPAGAALGPCMPRLCCEHASRVG